eukprot:CAMPEP_0184491392 /NCGR_PEP_ID=MMETSP0113_2-20130426/20326_1 /TAXON_ID=91329 /ORGANISM="Norrisiella sphaerica, Strain BC52" /LENGTH=483 /DNA_ID=CAMNT_0026875749 /DNA_START=75 /DNA_END=1526 /DNA_ORIENTATION=+
MTTASRFHRLRARTSRNLRMSLMCKSSLGNAVVDEFPILRQEVHDGKALLYLDSAATSQKPIAVTEAFRKAAQEVTSFPDDADIKEEIETARANVASLLNASPRDIVFTRGATEALNLVARGWGDANISEGDEIILTVMEHHSNLVPWQSLAERNRAVLKFVPLSKDQAFNMEAFKSLLNPGKTKIVAVNHVSNVLGCVNPVKEISELAHAAGALVSVDACQSVPHMPVDVKELGADFISASGHKMLGPTGIGFLWGRSELLNAMEPLNAGGAAMSRVSINPASTFHDAPAPWRFEAERLPYAEIMALSEACKYLQSRNMSQVHEYEMELGHYLWDSLSEIPGISLYGPSPSSSAGRDRGALVAFNCKGIHSNDLAFFLDQEGVAIRSGHHCTQPLHRALGVAGSARASLYLYNTREDIDKFCTILRKTLKMFSDMGFGVEETSPCPLVSTSDPTLRDPGIDRPCTDLWPKVDAEAEGVKENN